MQLSSKSRYGLKAMIEIGASKEKTISIKTISEKYEISESYLEQIIAILKKDKLVKSVRGAHGGYSLTKKTKEITLGDILRALEGNLNVSNCAGIDEKPCENACDCSFKYIWQKLNDGIAGVVDGITLEELIIDHVSKTKEV